MNTIISKQTLPSYIKEFLGFESDCILIHKKPHKSSSSTSTDRQEDVNTSFQSTRSIEDEIDLTGNPLQVDLDDSLNSLPNSVFSSLLPNWTVEESHHFPLSIEEARNLLNNKYNCKKSPIPTFCITNGTDIKKTVILGGHYSDESVVIYSAHILGVYSVNDIKLSVEQLQLRNQNDFKFKSDCVTYNFNRVYNIHGSPFFKYCANLENEVCNGSMALKTTWNTFSGEEPAVFETRLKLDLKVVSAHKNSLIKFIWDELFKLQKLVNLLENHTTTNDEDILLAEDPMTISDLINNIHSLCMIKLKKQSRVDHQTLDLRYLREETVLDKLWCLLNKCQNLKDLKNSLTTFFTVAQFENFETNDGILALRECLQHKDFLTDLTFCDALKLLIYMGFEKLKQDYFAIVNFYNPLHQVQLENKWRDFVTQDQQNFRKTVLTKNNLRIIDQSFNRDKMEFLHRLHAASELLVFLRQDVKTCTNISAENFSTICKHIYEKYIFAKSEENIENQLQSKLLDISCDLNSANTEIYKGKTPMTSLFETTCTVGPCETKTIIHVSQNSIFPKSIFDFQAGGDGPLFDDDLPNLRYATKFVSIKR